MIMFDMSPSEAASHLTDLVTSKAPHRDIAHFVVNWVEDHMNEQGVGKIGVFIGALDPHKISLAASSTVLRSSYRASAHLKQWLPFLRAVRKTHECDPKLDRFLIGLNGPYVPPSYY